MSEDSHSATLKSGNMDLKKAIKSTVTSAPYVYDPLPDGCVRFVEVFSDIFDAPLRCRIFISSFADAPLYEALSYVWGSQELLYDLECCDNVSTGILRIGPNLRDALLHLRYLPSEKRSHRLLWIDRICINQNDIEERASQVLFMRSIYRGCLQTLIWLGREDQDTEYAFDCANYIYKNDLIGYHTPWKTLAQFRFPPVSLEILKNSLRSLAILTDKAWFERAWTFQEVILPSKVSLICGKYSMCLECLRSCARPVVDHADARFSKHARNIIRYRKTESPVSKDLGRFSLLYLDDLLTLRRGAKAADPRDLIFSLLGLFEPSLSLALPPDYTISTQHLFTAAANYILGQSNNLGVLCSVESPRYTRDIKEEALPSWVPDWRASGENCINVEDDRNPRLCMATRGSYFCYKSCLNANELLVWGILVGTVKQAGRFNDCHSISDFNLPHAYIHTNQPISTALRHAQTLDENDVFEKVPDGHEYRRTLEAFYDFPGGHPRGLNLHRQKCNRCLIAHKMPVASLSKLSSLEFGHRNLISNLSRTCNQTANSRHFFTLDSGHLGFGPKRTKPGDQVFLLIGSHIPFILRPVGTAKFELVGACYVHGIMYGEGLHPSFGFNKEFYPGSDPGGVWDFSLDKVDNKLKWEKIECNKTSAESNDATTESRRETQSYWVSEEGGDPVLVETERIVLV